MLLLLHPATAPAGAVGLGSLRYNRVEGPFVSLTLEYPFRGVEEAAFRGEIGVAGATREARYRVELGHELGAYRRVRWRVGARAYDLTDTVDGWRTGEWENSLAALLFRSDFREYFGRRGVSVFVRHIRGEMLSTELEWRRDRYRSLAAEADFSLKGGTFRSNPPVGQDRRTSLLLSGTWERGRGRRRTRVFWEGEAAMAEDLRPARFRIEGRRTRPLGGNVRLLLRAVGGGGRGPLPGEWRHRLGGIDALRGLGLQAVSGERFLLVDVGLLDGGDVLSRVPLPVVSHLQLWADLEAGSAWRRDEGGEAGKWIGSGAIGVGDMASFLRFEAARRITRGRSPVRLYLRLNRPF